MERFKALTDFELLVISDSLAQTADDGYFTDLEEQQSFEHLQAKIRYELDQRHIPQGRTVIDIPRFNFR